MIATLMRWYYGGGLKHLLAIGFMGWSAAPILHFIEKWVFDDWQFVAALGILLVLDTGTGVWKGIKKKEFSSRGFGDVFTKVAIYAVALISVHSIGLFVNSREMSMIGDIIKHFDEIVYCSILFRELWSINENINALGYKILPANILQYMKDFNENGEYIPTQRGGINGMASPNVETLKTNSNKNKTTKKQ